MPDARKELLLNGGPVIETNNQNVTLDAAFIGENELSHGIVMRQKAQYDEAVMQSIGVPMERRNHYFVGKLPQDKHAKREHGDNGFAPTRQQVEDLERLLVIHEESSAISRGVLSLFGCGSLRSMKLRFTVIPSGDVLIAEKPFACGGWLCQPTTTNLMSKDASRVIGRVREDFRFSECCFACTHYNDIEVMNEQGAFAKRYTLRSNTCCCGRVNNCCGGTCFKNDAVYDILDTNGDIVANMTKTYGGNFWRLCCDFDTYTLEFPADATWEDRWLLLTSIVQLDFKVEEKD